MGPTSNLPAPFTWNAPSEKFLSEEPSYWFTQGRQFRAYKQSTLGQSQVLSAWIFLHQSFEHKDLFTRIRKIAINLIGLGYSGHVTGYTPTDLMQVGGCSTSIKPGPPSFWIYDELLNQKDRELLMHEGRELVSKCQQISDSRQTYPTQCQFLLEQLERKLYIGTPEYGPLDADPRPAHFVLHEELLSLFGDKANPLFFADASKSSQFDNGDCSLHDMLDEMARIGWSLADCWSLQNSCSEENPSSSTKLTYNYKRVRRFKVFHFSSARLTPATGLPLRC